MENYVGIINLKTNQNAFICLVFGLGSNWSICLQTDKLFHLSIRFMPSNRTKQIKDAWSRRFQSCDSTSLMAPTREGRWNVAARMKLVAGTGQFFGLSPCTRAWAPHCKLALYYIPSLWWQWGGGVKFQVKYLYFKQFPERPLRNAWSRGFKPCSSTTTLLIALERGSVEYWRSVRPDNFWISRGPLHVKNNTASHLAPVWRGVNNTGLWAGLSVVFSLSLSLLKLRGNPGIPTLPRCRKGW